MFCGFGSTRHCVIDCYCRHFFPDSPFILNSLLMTVVGIEPGTLWILKFHI